MVIDDTSQLELDLFQKFLSSYLVDFLEEFNGDILLWGFQKGLLNIPAIYLPRIKIYTRSNTDIENNYLSFTYVDQVTLNVDETLFILSNTYFFDIRSELNSKQLKKLHYPQLSRMQKFCEFSDNLTDTYTLTYETTANIEKTNIDLSMIKNLNLGSGKKKLEGYLGLDITPGCDLFHNLLSPLPFVDNTIENIFMSHVLEHFTKAQGKYILQECYRVLKPYGVIRISVPDFDIFVKAYIDKDEEFYYQSNGLEIAMDRFEGETLNEKFMFVAKGSGHKEFYNADSMKILFKKSGFGSPVQKQYRDGQIFNIENIDNRPEQSLFIEAVK